MATAALHPGVGHVYADAVAITAFNPRAAAKRHLHMALLSVSGIDDSQIARLDLGCGDSPTIDLGLHSPKDGEQIVTVGDTTFFSEDIRYAIFDGKVIGNQVFLQNLYLVAGTDFTNYFPLFQGRGTNAKLQLSLSNEMY